MRKQFIDTMSKTLEKCQIPLLDLNAQYASIKNEVLAKINKVFDSKYFINGPEVENLEKMVSEYCGSKYAIGVSSGSDALIAALMALNIGPGDEVITTPFSFFSQTRQTTINGDHGQTHYEQGLCSLCQD